MIKNKAMEAIQTRDVFVGDENAPVTITTFIDYESAACASLNDILKELLSSYEGKVKLNFRHFPMAHKHQKAMKAAEASVAAAQEGLFWPMHNLLFENNKKLGTISLKQYAKEAGSTNKRFLDQMVNGTYAWQVREDLLEAVEKGLKEVPVIFINGVRYLDEINYQNLQAEINKFFST
jgi:protein-disulfide isomerase